MGGLWLPRRFAWGFIGAATDGGGRHEAYCRRRRERGATMQGMIRIREAASADLPALGRLFDEYRQFYKLPTDVERATEYITTRLAAGESVVLVAVDESGELGGFTQLYPTWCSLLAG